MSKPKSNQAEFRFDDQEGRGLCPDLTSVISGSPERWLPVDEWPGYDVSDWGRIRSWWGAGSGQQGRRAITDTPKLIGGHVQQSGHRRVVLYRNFSTEKRTVGVHVLVLEAFVGPRPPGFEACHNDGNPGNNHLSNLRWDTVSSNQIDKLKHGTSKRAILTLEQIPEIWARIVAGEGNTAIAKDYSVSSILIAHIRSGASWSHVTQSLPGWPLHRITDAKGKEPIFAAPEYTDPAIEVWKVLDEWPAYRIFNTGRIQSSWEKVVGGSRNEFRMGVNWKDRATYPNKDGHYFLWMTNGTDKKMKYVHRLVLTAFAGLPPPGYVACHIDGDKTNNHASNLRWDTHRSNARDRSKHGKVKSD